MSLFARIFTTSARPRRRPAHTPFRPALDALEGRVVMSTATIPAAGLMGSAQIHALATTATTQLRVPISVTGINVTGITRDATSGVLNLVGNLTGTILGQAFTTPITGTVTPAANSRTCPVLNLNLQPISLSVLGLNVNTSAICLNVSARNGGGVLGNLLCGGLNNVLSAVTGASTTAATAQLNTLLSNTQLTNALNRSFSQARVRLASVTPAQGATCPVLNLTLGPVNLNLLGLRVKLDNCANGPVQVAVTGTQGGGILGNLVCGLTATRGNALLRQVAGILSQITATPPVV